MSDSNGSPAAPQTPDFSVPQQKVVLQQGIPVKSISYALEPEDKKETVADRRAVRKGASPGSFAPTVYQTNYSQPIKSPIKVDGIRRPDPEKEKLMAHAKAAIEAGIEPVYDDAGNIVSVTLPEGFVSEEEVQQRLAQLEAMKNGDMKVLQELFPVQSEYLSLQRESLALHSKLQNPSTLALLEQISQEAGALIDDTKEKPLYTKLDELKAKLEEFKKIVARAKDEVSKIPAPPAVTPAPTPAPTGAPTPAPTAAPVAAPDVKIPPTNLIFSAWTFQSINDQEKRKKFKAIFDDYFAFMKSVERAKKTASFISVIEEKWDIADAIGDALKSKDWALAETLVDRLNDSLKEKKEELQKMLEAEEEKNKYERVLKEVQKKLELKIFDACKKKADELKARLSSAELVAVVDRLVNETKNTKEALDLAVAPAASSLTVEQLTRLRDTYETNLATLGAFIEQEEERQDVINSTDGGRGRAPILRPIVPGSPKSGNSIYLRDGRKITVDERAGELAEEKRIQARGDDLEKSQGMLETRKLYEHAFARNKEEFLRVYTDVRVGDDGDIYTRNAKLLTHPHRTIIEDILAVGGIELRDATDEEKTLDKRTSEARRNEAIRIDPTKQSSLAAHKLVYSPVNDPYQGKVRPNDLKTEEEKLAHPQPSQNPPRGEVSVVDESRSKMKLDKENSEWGGMVGQVREQHEMAQANEPLSAQEVTSPESKKEKALQKVGKLGASLNGRFSNPKWQMIIAATVIAGAAAYVAQQPNKGNTPPAEASAPTQNEDRLMWRKYFHAWKEAGEEWKDFPDDISRLSPEKLVEKYAPKFYAGSNNPNLAQTWFTNYIIDAQRDKEGNIIDENVYRLLPPAREELSKLIKMLDGASWATKSGKAEGATLAQMIQDVKRKVSQKEH